ncbi:MAG: polysaccharide deacetylase family protein [Minwuia sp.]|nr:polysaccharide deacetylase family protein [Minwuia sp.]
MTVGDYCNRYRDWGPGSSLRSVFRDVTLRILSASQGKPAEPALRLIYCHYVFDDQVADFEGKVEFLKQYGRFISGDEVLERIALGTPIDENLFHLSFDDGFRNIISNALPVLERLNVPSTFFVPTAVIGAEYDVVRHYCLNTTHYPRVFEMASWDDLKLAAEKGMTIASHTRTHSRLSEISNSGSQLEYEISGSKQDIEQNLGMECRHFSWPYGSIADADAGSLRAVRDAGYDSCFGAYRGRVVPGKTSAFHIPRHHFEPQWPLSHLKYFAFGGRE